jgi:hypothetical protein
MLVAHSTAFCCQLEIVWLASNQGANLFFTALHEMPITDPVIREEGEGNFSKNAELDFRLGIEIIYEMVIRAEPMSEPVPT